MQAVRHIYKRNGNESPKVTDYVECKSVLLEVTLTAENIGDGPGQVGEEVIDAHGNPVQGDGFLFFQSECEIFDFVFLGRHEASNVEPFDIYFYLPAGYYFVQKSNPNQLYISDYFFRIHEDEDGQRNGLNFVFQEDDTLFFEIFLRGT